MGRLSISFSIVSLKRIAPSIRSLLNAEDFIILNSDAYQLIKFDDKMLTGSSIMPQKKNPDPAELIRGRTGINYGKLNSILTIMKGLPISYFKDLQDDKALVFDGYDTLKDTLIMSNELIKSIRPNKKRMFEMANQGYTTATDFADYLVQNNNLSFREAYKISAKLVNYAEKKKKKFFSSSNHLLRGQEHHRLDRLLNRFINHEQKGVPSKAGTDEDANDVFDMKRMRVFLKLLGDPHKGKTYKTIHVGGTKGKGTQIALLSSCLTKAGYTIGTYKSPHVHTFAERIRVNGRYNDKELSELFEQIWKKRTDLETNDDVQKEEDDALKQLTHFEVLTALALKYFEQKNVDIALVEVGLGGVRDATNVFDENSLECAILTHIGEEHLEALGGSIESIVRAKTGICKPSRPTFIGHQNDRKVDQLIREGVHNQGGGVIVENNAKVRLVDINVDGGTLKQRVSVASVPKGEKEEEFQSRSIINLPLLGPHQRENAELALSVLSHMMTTTKTTTGKTWDKLTWESIREGFEA